MSHDMMQALSGSSLLSLSVGTLPAAKAGMTLEANPFASQLALMTGPEAVSAVASNAAGAGAAGNAAFAVALAEAVDVPVADAVALAPKADVAVSIEADIPDATAPAIFALPEDASPSEFIEAASKVANAERQPASTPNAKARPGANFATAPVLKTPAARETQDVPLADAVSAKPVPAVNDQLKPEIAKHLPEVVLEDATIQPAVSVAPFAATFTRAATATVAYTKASAPIDAGVVAEVPATVRASVPAALTPEAAISPATPVVAELAAVVHPAAPAPAQPDVTAAIAAAPAASAEPAAQTPQAASPRTPVSAKVSPDAIMTAAVPARDVPAVDLTAGASVVPVAAATAVSQPRKVAPVALPGDIAINPLPSAPIAETVEDATPATTRPRRDDQADAPVAAATDAVPVALPVIAPEAPVMARPEATAPENGTVRVAVSATPAPINEIPQPAQPTRAADAAVSTAATVPAPTGSKMAEVDSASAQAAPPQVAPAQAALAQAALAQAAPAQAAPAARAGMPVASTDAGVAAPAQPTMAAAAPQQPDRPVAMAANAPQPAAATPDVPVVAMPATDAQVTPGASTPASTPASTAPALQAAPAATPQAPSATAEPVRSADASNRTVPQPVAVTPDAPVADVNAAASAPLAAVAAQVSAQPQPIGTGAQRTVTPAPANRAINAAARAERPAQAMSALFDLADPVTPQMSAVTGREARTALAAEAIPPSWAAALNAVTPQAGAAPLQGPAAPVAAAPGQSAPLETLAFDAGFVANVETQIARVMGSGQMVRMQIMPEHLGRIDIEMLAGPERDSVRIVTEHDAVRDTLVQSQVRLEQDLRGQGNRNTDVTVELRQQSPGTQGGSAQQQQQRGQPGTEAGATNRDTAQRPGFADKPEDTSNTQRRPRGNVRYA